MTTDDPRTRADDEPDAQTWKKRRIAMHADGPSVAINGMLARLRVASLILKDVGVTTILLVFIFGWLTGWIPFPLLATLQDILRKCVQIMATSPSH